jgi:hypothetical protein
MELTREQLDSYLKEIAHHLGGWHVDTREQHCLYLIGDGMKVFIRYQGHRQSEKERLFFSGVFPRGYSSSMQSGGISAAYSRPAQAVANDIKKRLLGDLKKETIAAYEWIAVREAEINELDQITSLVKNVGFNDSHYGYNDRSYLRTFYGRKDHVGLKFEVSKKYGTTLTLSKLTPEELIKIAYFIKTL